jgi:hypothetical protein
MLRVAHEWRLLDRIPKIRLLSGEHNREFVLSYEQERIYLEFAPELLRDAAILMLDTGWVRQRPSASNGPLFARITANCEAARRAIAGAS